MTTSIRILVADDHPVVRDGLIAILSTQPDFDVVGDTGDGDETVHKVADLHPDVLLLDLEMPGKDGVAVLQRLHELNASTRVIVFTAFDTDDRILAAVRAGAQGYLLKGVPRDEIFEAVRVVHAGNSLLQPIIASRLLRQVSEDHAGPPGITALTSRELEVLRLLMRGLQNKEIAMELIVTERTVKFHVSSILMKLGAGNRTEAVAIATRHGVGKS
ncbi:MAG TPA: response regulator transcription factor [Ktedonobacterales bacterium]|nr:response regulator transcription factor [Ktedonobacterales bacterium]